ncbi:MAG TPA: alpha-glucuronidase family glycosyl hydrolase, partial [Pyrinomonadaceae bacterium]|nr:alpha-glucuronidase family glycosyl hydrolase [Pyrinomonadaceae bacterium]
MIIKAKSKNKKLKILIVIFAITLLFSNVKADDGYRLWLRYDALPETNAKLYKNQISSIKIDGNSPIIEAIREELKTALSGLLSSEISFGDKIENGTLLIGTPDNSLEIKKLKLPLNILENEGFLIRSAKLQGKNVTIIAANTEIGTLYGTFHFLRLLQTSQPISNLNISEKPKIQLRMLNHWDNLDGSIERGYAGKSLWNWSELPEKVDARLKDYARANASIGINAAVLNNVNANSKILSTEYLKKVAAIADVFRPYGIKVFLSARFSSPMELSGLKTADPFDENVKKWWKEKADEIYQLIPDFGGFLVKANSEGQPGPRTYNRNHVDGANMLVEALKPHRGIVIWRAFVYDAKPGYDRAGAAYENLQPFDGKFAENAILQVKNGPID